MILLSSFVSARCIAFVMFNEAAPYSLNVQGPRKKAVVQSSHRLQTPRIGGLAFILGGIWNAHFRCNDLKLGDKLLLFLQSQFFLEV